MKAISAEAIVLVSGGMDSLVTAAIAAKAHSTLAFLHMNYGQKTEKRELISFENIAAHYNVPTERQLVVDISFLKQIGGCSLTDDSISVTKFEGDSGEVPNSYVPFRNTHIISIAVSWAEIIGAKQIYIGAVHEDSSGYPDCRPSYYRAMNSLIKEGTKNGDITVTTPIINLSKSEIVKKAIELKAPIELSYSCYDRNDKACGVCDSCALRLRGFEKVGIPDPIEYIKRPSYKSTNE